MKLENKDFFRITNYVRIHFGINLIGKRDFVEKRLDRILMDCNYTDFHTFMNDLEVKQDNSIHSKLIGLLVTNYTYFLREQMHFEVLENVILPKLNKIQKKEIRIWSAATSSGQEAYSILLVILDYLKDSLDDWNIEILGTDISESMLNKARKGKFRKEELDKIPQEWVCNYFTKITDERYKINDSLKDYISFDNLNLVTDPYPDKLFQVIFLRNVLIYFDSGLINQIVDKISNYLEVGGYLFIGMKETIEIKSDKLICIQPSIYRKI